MNTSKACTKCGQVKELTEFGKHSRYKDGHANKCKECKYAEEVDRGRTLEGRARAIYRNQVKHSRKRGHVPPEYSEQELVDALVGNSKFLQLHNQWVNSKYSKDVCPTVDRKDDSIGYTKANVQLLAWKDNRDKSTKDRQSGVDTRTCKQVSQFTLLGEKVTTFFSIAEAERQTGIWGQTIHRSCNAGKHTAGGFRWEYT